MSDFTELSQDELKRVLEYNKDTGIFTWKISRQGIKRDIAGFIDNRGYRVITINRKTQLAHRLAWLYVYGGFPKNHIDHIDHNADNNSISNLRDVSVRKNSHNRIDNNKFVGVYWYGKNNKWVSLINIKGKINYLGTFNTHIAACYARHQANLEVGHV